MSDKAQELMLIELRGSAPLVRTLREFDGYPSGTLGYIAGVDGPWLKVRLAGSDEPTLMSAKEIQEVE